MVIVKVPSYSRVMVFSNNCLLFLFSWKRGFLIGSAVVLESSMLHHKWTISGGEMHLLISYIMVLWLIIIWLLQIVLLEGAWLVKPAPEKETYQLSPSIQQCMDIVCMSVAIN